MTKISFNQIDKMTAGVKRTVDYEKKLEDGSTITINIKTSIGPEEMDSLVNSVADAVFVNGEYKPALLDIVWFKALLAYYTNIKTDGLSNERLMALYVDFYETLCQKIEINHYMALRQAVEDKIKFTLDCALSEQRRRLDEAIEALNKEREEITSQMDMLIKFFEKLAKSAEGIDKGQLQADLHALASKSEREIVESVLAVRDNESEK